MTEEQLAIAGELGLGEYYILNLPKIDYKSGDKLDLTSIEILVKDNEGNAYVLGYDDLVSDENIKMNFHNGDEISLNYYNPLFNEEYLKFETEETKEQISHYLEKNQIQEYNPKLSIQIPNYDEINIDFNLEEELNLSPLELFAVLKMENSSINILNSDKLTYKINEEIKLDNLTFVIKDEKGLVKIVSYKDLDDESIKVDFPKLDEAKKELNKENSIQTYITLEKEDFEKLYIPITLVSDDVDINSLDTNSNIDFVKGTLKEDNKTTITTILDVKSLEDIKNINLEFLNGENEVKILDIIKSDGYQSEDISLNTHFFRDKDNFDIYKDLTTKEIAKKIKNLDIKNPIYFSSILKPGYKYIITLEIEGKLNEDVILKSSILKPASDEKLENEETEITIVGKDSLIVDKDVSKETSNETNNENSSEGNIKDEIKGQTEDENIKDKPSKDNTSKDDKTEIKQEVNNTEKTTTDKVEDKTESNKATNDKATTDKVETNKDDKVVKDNVENTKDENKSNEDGVVENKIQKQSLVNRKVLRPTITNLENSDEDTLDISDHLVSKVSRESSFIFYANQIFDLNVDQVVHEVNDTGADDGYEYVDYIDWTFTFDYKTTESYQILNPRATDRHVWHSFNTTGDSGLGKPEIIAIKRVHKTTGQEYDLLNNSNYKNYISNLTDAVNDFKSISYRDGFPLNNVNPSIYKEVVVVRTPVTRFQYDYNIDYHFSANISKETTGTDGTRYPIGLQQFHRTKSIHKMEATTYRGEVIDTSYIYLDSQGQIMPTDTMNTIPEGDLAIARSVIGRYIGSNRIKWQVSDRNLSQNVVTSQISSTNLVDDSQSIDSVNLTLYKTLNEFATSGGNIYRRYGNTKQNTYQQILNPGEIAYYEITTIVKSDKETVEHSFTTGKETVEAKLNGLKKPIVINKKWDNVPEAKRVKTKFDIKENNVLISSAYIEKGSSSYSSQTPVYVYSSPNDWSANRTRPLSKVNRVVSEDEAYLNQQAQEGKKFKLFNSSLNNEQNIYTFTNGYEAEYVEYGITKINPMEQNQYELPAEPGRGRTYGWTGDVSGELRVPKGFKAGEYINLKMSNKLKLSAITDPNSPLFKIRDKDTGDVLFNVYKVSDDELRFVATDKLEEKAQTRIVTADWYIGQQWTINNNDTIINGRLVPQGTKLGRGITINQNEVLDYDDPNNLFKPNASGLDGVSNGVATFKSSLSRDLTNVSDVQGDLKVHFEANFDEILLKNYDNKVISDKIVDGKRKVTWRIVSNEGKYKILSNGKQTDTIINDHLSVQGDKTKLWTIGKNDETLENFKAGIATRANEIGGYDQKSYEEIPIYTTAPTGEAAKGKYLLITGLPTNPNKTNSTFTFRAHNLDPEDTLIIEFDVEVISTSTIPEKKGTINNRTYINPRPSGGAMNYDAYYSPTTGYGSAAFDNLQSFEINKTTFKNGEEIPVTEDSAEFVLYKIENGERNAIIRKSTDSNGKATFDRLTPGDYVLVETKAPNGYTITVKEHPIKITDQGISLDGQLGGSFNIVNPKDETPKYGEFTLTKVDSDDNKKLENAVFTLTDSDGNSKEYRTGQDGIITFKNLKPGNYRLKETKAPEGYELSPKEWSVYVNSQGRTFVTELGDTAPGTGGSAGSDVTSRVVLNTVSSSISFTDLNNDGKLNVGTEENKINIKMNMSIDGSVNPGDYFTIKESDTLHYNMLQPDKGNYVDIKDANGVILAKQTYGPNFNFNDGSRKELIYVFTEAISGLKNLSLSTTWGHSVNINYAQNDGNYDFRIEIGNQKLSKTIAIDHLKPAEHQSSNININANYLYTNDQTGSYTQLGYINPLKKDIQGESTITAYVPKVSGSINQADIGPEKTKIEVYKFNDNEQIPDAVVLDKSKVTLINPSQYIINFTEIGSNKLKAVEIKLNEAIGTSAYIVLIHSEMQFPGEEVTGNTILGQFINLSNNGNYVEKASAIGTSNSSGGGGGSSDYTPPAIVVTNTKKVEKEGKFEIIKTGESKDVLLPGAKFTLTPINPTGTTIEKISGQDGKITFDKLKSGTYELSETEAPEGYTKTDKTWTVTVDLNGVTTVVASKVKATSTAIKVLENRISSLSSPKSTLFNPLRVNLNSNLIQPTSLPQGVQDSDIVTTGTSIEYGNSNVTTSARYLGNDQFEVKIDIVAGGDTTIQGEATDVVFVVQAPVLTQDIKTTLKNKINQYGDNVKIGIVVYDERTTYNKDLRLLQKADAISTLNSAQSTTNWPNSAVRTQYALQTANNIFANGSSQNKELIMVVGNSIGNSNGGIRTQVNNLKNKGVTINNFYIGTDNGYVQTRMEQWNALLQLGNNPTVNASNYNTTVLNENLKVYGTKVIKAVENATFNVSFNNDFTFVQGSTRTSKPGSNQWHSGYNSGTNSIDLKAGELTLNANETATMTFNARSNSTIVAGRTYPLINSIVYRPNTSLEATNIEAPSVKVEENKINVTVENVHLGGVPQGSNITFALKRKVGQTVDMTYIQNGNIGVTGSITFQDLPKKDSSGNLYTYYLANVTSSNDHVIITGSNGTVSGGNGTITISTKENRGFNVSVDWQGLNPVGAINVQASNGKTFTLNAENKYFYEDLSANAQTNSISQITGPEGYEFKVSGSEGSYTIKVSKKEIDTPKIEVANAKLTELIITKTDEGGNLKLKDAIFTLKGSSDNVSNYENTQTTDTFGQIKFTGLQVGEYTLEEIQAPTGYEKVEGTWKVIVTEDGKVLKVTIEEPDNTEVINTYQINNQIADDIYNNHRAVMNIQTEIKQIGDSDDFNLKVKYQGKDAYYNYEKRMTINFNKTDFEVSDKNGSDYAYYWQDVYTGQNRSGELNFTVKIKNLNDKDNKTISPISSIYFDSYNLPNNKFAKITPKLGQTVGQTIELKPKDGSTSTFEYSIANKPGKEKFSLIKKDANGIVLQGVEFELLDSDGRVFRKETTNDKGEIVFNNLPYGQYWLRESKTLPGYILDNTLIPVLIGKDWAIPENPENPKDVSNSITVDTTKINGMLSTTKDPDTVYPNKTEGIVAGVNFIVNSTPIINPGDTFTLTLSDNVDLDGIGNVEERLLDIVTSSGVIAKAKVNNDRRSITYTFTEYVKYNTFKGFKINTQMFINRMAIKNNTNNVPISIQIGQATNTAGKFEDTINVNYENYISDPQTVKTYIIKNNKAEGKFTALVYVNPQSKKDFNRYLEFSSDQLTGINSVEVYSSTTGGGSEYLPWSYGVDYTKLTKINNPNYNYNKNRKLISFNLGNQGSTNSYVIKIEGSFDNKSKEFKTKSDYYRDNVEYDNWGYEHLVRHHDYWETYTKFYDPESSGEGETVFNIVNIKNKIEYTKVEGNIINTIPQGPENTENENRDANQKVLQGAKFQLKMKNGETWENYGEELTSDQYGKFSWEGLPTGEYQVWETKAPDGYITPENYVSSFTVDATGKIVNILNNNTIIPNEKESMKFYIDKIWKDSENKDHSIINGTLELELKAPEGTTFPDDVKVDESQPTDRKYKITEISQDKKTITISIDLSNAYEGVNSDADENKAIRIKLPANWPSGNYILKETKAPAGYIIGTETYTLSVDQDNKTIKYGDKVLYSKVGENITLGVLKIENEKGKYPSTGGMGTAIYTLMGLSLMALAFIEYRRKKVIINE